jgi:CRP/FNR family cyclic AMP-dependent transcriptional regulator
MAELTFEPGEVIFHAGDESACAYTIISGHVEILNPETQPPSRIATLKPGQIFGEMGLVDERPRTYTARAMEPVHLLTVSQDELIDLLMNHPEESLRFLRTLFERLRGMNTRRSIEQLRPLEPTPSLAFSAMIIGISPRAARVVSPEGLRVGRLPFRVGRTRGKDEGQPLEVNDLSLPDMPPYNVSRNHFSIDRQRDRLVVRDRGSFLGTIVNGVEIGGRHPLAAADLEIGENDLVVGSLESPFQFRVIVDRGPGPA